MGRDKEILGWYAKKGYKLGKAKDGLVTVWHNKSIIGSQKEESASPEVLQDICRRHMEGLTAPKI